MRRRTAARLLITIGIAAFTGVVVLALVPGGDPACGSLLMPLFPPALGTRCVPAQAAMAPATAVAAAAGVAAVFTGTVLLPQHRRSRG